LQQPQLLQGHPTVAVQPADLLQHSCNGGTVPPEGGWELSPSGAASPCGAVHSELLDLFADLADTEVVVYNRCVLLSAVYCSLCKGCRWKCSCLVRWACACWTFTDGLPSIVYAVRCSCSRCKRS
jgi:hypothetical protein